MINCIYYPEKICDRCGECCKIEDPEEEKEEEDGKSSVEEED